jgi:ABC-2 type transport system ATP-binding protein
VAEVKDLVSRNLRTMTVHFKRPTDGQSLAGLPGVSLLSVHDGTSVSLRIEGDLESLVKALGAFPVSDLEIDRPSLEEVFLAFYEASSD